MIEAIDLNAQEEITRFQKATIFRYAMVIVFKWDVIDIPIDIMRRKQLSSGLGLRYLPLWLEG